MPLSKRSDLKHPAFFYWLMTPLADPEQSAQENAARFRIANFTLSIIAVGIFLFASAKLLNSPGALVTYGLTVVAFPFLAVVGGTFNNDNLALLGAALAFMGVVRMARGEIGVAAGGLMAGQTHGRVNGRLFYPFRAFHHAFHLVEPGRRPKRAFFDIALGWAGRRHPLSGDDCALWVSDADGGPVFLANGTDGADASPPDLSGPLHNPPGVNLADV